jgi:hypothetical protein
MAGGYSASTLDFFFTLWTATNQSKKGRTTAKIAAQPTVYYYIHYWQPGLHKCFILVTLQ